MQASSASIKLDNEDSTHKGETAEVLLQHLVERICDEQIGRQVVAADIMTAPVESCEPTDTIDEVGKYVLQISKKS
jgi:predicted transcriptional regulator